MIVNKKKIIFALFLFMLFILPHISMARKGEDAGDKAAFPGYGERGMSKREIIAAIVLATWVPQNQSAFTPNQDAAVRRAVEVADALITELNKK